MRIRWFGQSAFLLSGAARVAIDPFGRAAVAMRERGFRFDYPPIENVEAELVLVTHEHADHNGVEAVAGSPQLIRSTAGRFDTPVGEVLAVASEHDQAAGTERGANTIFVFELDGLRVCHLGDFGQRELRWEQREAIGRVDILFLPVGGGPTIDGTVAALIARALAPRLVVPMHYRTPAVDFLEPVDRFLQGLTATEIEQPATSECEAEDLLARHAGRTAVVLAAPSADRAARSAAGAWT